MNIILPMSVIQSGIVTPVIWIHPTKAPAPYDSSYVTIVVKVRFFYDGTYIRTPPANDMWH